MTPDPEISTDTERSEQLAAYIASARWFGGKGRAFEVTAVTEIVLAPDVSTNLVRLAFNDGGEDLYQVPLSSYDEPQERLPHALVGTWEGQYHYDSVHDRDAMAVWLNAFAGTTAAELEDRIAFTRVDDHLLDLEAHSTLYSGEQSNSSVAFGEDSLLKVFRRVHPGTNPDIEIHEVLTRAGNAHVATLYGHVVATVPSEPGGQDDRFELAMLQQFLRTASDGWDLVLNNVRNVVMDTDLKPEEIGGNFGGDAHRLGADLAAIHEILADAFGTSPLDTAAVATAMAERLDAAITVVPEIAAHAAALSERLAAIVHVTGRRAQRIHGDLHLGQTLRTSLGWKIVDFEGEPAKTLVERQLPDSPWRDVAGMIRSFDYAASTVARDLGGSDDEAAEISHRALDWTAHTTASFLAGYTEHRGEPMSDAEATLLRAYLADKAVYEVVYEARNRPGWIGIPLTALTGIAESPA